jgi:hypothetical protein
MSLKYAEPTSGPEIATDPLEDGSHAELQKIIGADGVNKLAVTSSGAAKTDGSAITQPVSAAALPLPSGASTEATLAAIKAKTDNLDVALSTRTKPADTQPVSAAALPLPSGASTEATLAAIKAKTDNLDVALSGTDHTRVSKANTYGPDQYDVAIWTPASGKRFVVLGLIITPTAAGALLKIYDNANAAANMLYAGMPPLGSIVINFTHPWVGGAADNVLRYATGGSANGDLTVYGYEK